MIAQPCGDSSLGKKNDVYLVQSNSCNDQIKIKKISLFFLIKRNNRCFIEWL